MTSTHPRTAALTDPGLPAVSALLDARAPAPLRAAVESAGATIRVARATSVTWWPGSSITVGYRAEVEGVRPQHLVAAAGSIPEGALVVEGGDGQVGVWRVPHDPALPGLAAALDPVVAATVLGDLGGDATDVRTTLRAYRPGRRAVVAVDGRRPGIYLKLVRPRRVSELHARHRSLSSSLPIPQSLGVDTQRGIVALQTLPGATLRQALDDPASQLPSPSELVGWATDLPDPPLDGRAPSAIERAPRLAGLLCALLPDQAGRIDAMLASIGDDDVPDRVPAHGDFYEAQVMVDDGRVVGFLDIDTYGWGRPGDDPAVMLGHLSLWASLSRSPERVRRYGEALLRLWDARLDPVDLRRRVAAVVLGLATGPFRVQRPDWPEETVTRLDLAQRWLDSAHRADETGLTASSAPSHGRG